jgi:hypothetical protein
MKDDDSAGGFVFIDEPFAHLDVRNIQLVGHFLKSTRAQYLLTTPITHNVEVFEPSEITLGDQQEGAWRALGAADCGAGAAAREVGVRLTR